MERSVNTLIQPNEDNPISSSLEVTKPKNIKLLPNYLETKDKFFNKSIKPKYIFNQEILNKLNKLKDIFLEFDTDHTGTNSNKIRKVEYFRISRDVSKKQYFSISKGPNKIVFQRQKIVKIRNS